MSLPFGFSVTPDIVTFFRQIYCDVSVVFFLIFCWCGISIAGESLSQYSSPVSAGRRDTLHGFVGDTNILFQYENIIPV